MRQTDNLGLALYDTTDKMNITGTENSLNHNMELIDAEIGDMSASIYGEVTENTYTETYDCTAGKAISGDLRFFSLKIPAGEEYTFSIQQDGIFGGNITAYQVASDNSKTSIGVLKEATGWSVTNVATQEIRQFAIYAEASRIVASGTITLVVTFSSESEGSIYKRLKTVEAGLAEIDSVREKNEELYAAINGSDYEKTFKCSVSCTAGSGLNGANPIMSVEIKKGVQYIFQLADRGGVTTEMIAAYALDADGNRTSIGMLKSTNNDSLTAIAGFDIVGFSLYIAGSGVTANGTMQIIVTMHVESSDSLGAKVNAVSESFASVAQDAMRGSSVMGFNTLFYSDCYEIGSALNNDNNATYVYHDFDYDISADDCIGVRVSAIENATATVKGYISGSADGTEYTQLLTFREAGVYHVYPPAEYTKIKVRLYPTTTGGLDDVTAKYRELEIFTSSDGRRRIAPEYAPRTWDVPAYYLRGGYMDGKVEEILGRVDASGGDCDTFFFVTDMHWRWNSRVSPALVGYLSRRLNIERLFFGGDWVDGYSENGVLAFKEAFPGKVYNVLGNHDYMDYWCKLGEDENSVHGHTLTPAMATFQLISRTDDIVLGDTMYGYYHVDNPTNKMRYIVLQVYTDESAVRLEQTQLDWLDSVLSSLPDGYLAVVFAHFLGEVNSDGSTFLNRATGVKVAEVCDRYAAKVACMFNGHTHIDGMVKTDGGIPVFVTTCDSWSLAGLQDDTDNPRVAGTRTEQAFEVVVVDKTNHKVSAVRIGCPARNGTDTNVEVREQTFVSG